MLEGSAETIRKSYKLVAKRLRSQSRNADRYYLRNPDRY